MNDNEKDLLTTRVGIKGNVRYITITDNDPTHWDKLISITKTYYTWYAYIYHDKDDTDKHIHILAMDKGGTTLKSHCERFSSVIPSNFVCKVKSGRAMARYLTHHDQKEKHQYSIDEIITNSIEKLKSFYLDGSETLNEYADYRLVMEHKITINDFIERHQGEFYQLNLYQKIALFKALERTIND